MVNIISFEAIAPRAAKSTSGPFAAKKTRPGSAQTRQGPSPWTLPFYEKREFPMG